MSNDLFLYLLFPFIAYFVLIYIKTKGRSAPDYKMGQLNVFVDKANAIAVQLLVVLWFVAMYGLKYAKSNKSITLEIGAPFLNLLTYPDVPLIL